MTIRLESVRSPSWNGFDKLVMGSPAARHSGRVRVRTAGVAAEAC
jgi:hypothetical protein